MTALVYLDAIYDEALALLEEVRDYLVHGDVLDRESLTPCESLILYYETMRLAARLSQILGWLLEQKAVHAGDVGWVATSSEQTRLAAYVACHLPEFCDDDAV